MKKGIIILLFSLGLLSCKGKDKEGVVKTEQVENQEQKKLHWWELPQKITEYDIEIMEMRSKENQEKIGKLWDAFIRIENKDHSKIYLTMEDINLTNDLFYQAIKSQGFQFPNEDIFAKRIKDIFNVDIYADHSNNPRIVRMGDFLILSTKVYPAKYYKQVPTIVFDTEGYIFDIKRRFLTNLETINGIVTEVTDDYGESYDRYNFGFYNLALNNYIFYNSNAAFVRLNKSLVSSFDEDFGYEKFSEEYDYYYKEINKDKLDLFRSENEGMYRDYRMYERFLFVRDFNGEFKVKKKMLEATVELAKEDEAYIRVPLDYYFIQMTTKYISNEYAAELGKVDDYRKELEPYYTKEERAKIWVYTSLLELNLSPKVSSSIPYTFISLATQYPELYEVAKANNFFGEDMSQVLEYL